MPREMTTVQISMNLDSRIKRLAESKATELGLASSLAKGKYLEILVSEEEKRQEKPA